MLTMQTVESNLYLDFTKSIVDGFERFVLSIEKNDAVLGDNELRFKLKLIGKTLQSILNKWENISDTKFFSPCSEEISHKEVENHEVAKRRDSLNDFELMIASSVGDVTLSKVTSVEVSNSSSNETEFSILDNITSTFSGKNPEILESGVTFQLSKNEAEIIRKFSVENVKKEWILGCNGFYIEQTSRGSWRCNPCKLEALSYANIISHTSGKGHIKKLNNFNRETSPTILNDDTSLDSYSSFLYDVTPEIIKKDDGADIIGGKRRKNSEF